MKKRAKKLLALAMAFAICLGVISTSTATTANKSAVLNYKDITITLDGHKITPKDVNGKIVEPFIIDGTTYAPVRAIAESLGLSVDWDGKTHKVTLSTAAEDAEPTRNALVDVEAGRYMGTKENGVYRFVGIQYGVAERFQAATKAPSFNGIHTATTYGNASPTDNQAAKPGATDTLVTSYMTPNSYWAENEDCLYLNVWSTALNDKLTGETTDASRPVLFFIHGGGLTNGSGNELTYYDGANFARETGAIFVSVNHRLNILGYSNLTAYNEQYGKNYETNLGEKDLVLALEWVRDNIDQFGGDPNNVTILGQSGGGSKVSGLMGSPKALELFDKAIFCSGGPSSFTATQESTQQSGKDWVAAVKEQKGAKTDKEALELLETMPYDELYAVTGGKYPGIVIDDFMTESCYDSAKGTWGDLSKDVPVMISATFAEMAGSMANNCLPALVNNTTDYGAPALKNEWVAQNNNDYMTEEYLMSQLTARYGDDTDAAIAAFLKAYPHLNKYDLRNYNGRNDNAALARVNSGADKTYVGFYAYKFPIFGGTMAWHTGGDLPFIFQNVDMIDNMVAGDKAGAQRLADAASGAVYSFMKTGDPSTDSLTWDAFTAKDGAVMVLDGDSTLRTGFFAKELENLRTAHPSGGGFPS